MSDKPTLYRECMTCSPGGVYMTAQGFPDQCPVCASTGFVPAEPNYEAAAVPILDSMAMAWVGRGQGGHEDLMLNPELMEAADLIAHASVDAALGEPT